MLPSRGLLRTSPNLGLARVKSIPTPRTSLSLSARQFGTSLRSNSAVRLVNTRSPLSSTRIGAAVTLGAASHSILSSRLQARYASTGPDTSPAAAPVTGLTDGGLATPVDGASSLPADLTGSELLNMPETLGFLKAFGLDYGWGFTATLQWYLEHIYVWTGLPWWASIAIAAVGIRVAIFKPSLQALIQQQKLNDLRKNPRFAEMESEMKTKMATGGDLSEVSALQHQMGLLRKAHGVKIWKTMIPMINIPISFGMFRLLRGMSSLPVPSLETGGFLWFPDLTMADPFFILPVLTTALVWRGMTIALPYMPVAQQKTMRMISMVILPVSLIFTINLSSAMQFYFFITSLLHTAQSWLFYQNWFRAIFNLGPPPSAGDSPLIKSNTVTWQAPRGGVIEAKATPVKAEDDSYKSHLTSSFSSAKETISSTLGERSAKMQQKQAAERAKEYEDKRALEEKEKQIARREYKQMKKHQR